MKWRYFRWWTILLHTLQCIVWCMDLLIEFLHNWIIQPYIYYSELSTNTKKKKRVPWPIQRIILSQSGALNSVIWPTSSTQPLADQHLKKRKKSRHSPKSKHFECKYLTRTDQEPHEPHIVKWPAPAFFAPLLLPSHPWLENGKINDMVITSLNWVVRCILQFLFPFLFFHSRVPFSVDRTDLVFFTWKGRPSILCMYN